MSMPGDLYREIYDFLHKRSCPPTRAYLGLEEWAELFIYVRRYDIISPANTGMRPFKFEGLEVFRVNEDRHLFVA